MLGGLLYATISFEIGIRCPEKLVRRANFSASGGVAIISLHRAWMCCEGGFEGWKGKWYISASLSDLAFVSFQTVVFSYATRVLALVSAVASSGRMVDGE